MIRTRLNIKKSTHSTFCSILGACLKLVFIIGLIVFQPNISLSEPPVGVNDTMLMFVGEDLELLTIASRREEKAWDAPAVASVITKKQIRESGFLTLSDALSTIPGFYMAQKEWGAQPYLRGISDSVLFLYNTVPLRSDASKNLHQLNQELSLVSAKRVEIIRGPGSVLWGADAFAGIVNFVPLSGKDIDGFETGFIVDNDKENRMAYLNAGLNSEYWDVAFSLCGREGQEEERSSNVVSFWDTDDPPVAPEERFGEKKTDDSRYLGVSGSATLNDTISVSCRLSDIFRPFVFSDEDTGLSWIESRDIYSGHVKLDINTLEWKKVDIRFSAYKSWLKPEYMVVDNFIKQSENTQFTELVLSRPFFSGSGLLTLGVSYREKTVQKAPVWEMYYPDFFSAENLTALPLIPRDDYSTSLWSVFTQYNQEIGSFDFFAGIRNDDHDDFKDHTSFNYGMVWEPYTHWMFKLIYGTAYRTPFALHILDSEGIFSGTPDEEKGGSTKHELEKINNVSFQIAFKASSNMKFSMCGFNCRIDNHVVADKYAVLSLPNSQKVKGMEFEANYSPFKALNISSNLTVMENTGPNEAFSVVEGFHLFMDGSAEKLYRDYSLPYNVGPEVFSNLIIAYQINDNIKLASRMKYVASLKAFDLINEETQRLPSFWLFDLNLVVDDIYGGFGITINLENVLDRSYEVPGTFSKIDGQSFNTECLIRKEW